MHAEDFFREFVSNREQNYYIIDYFECLKF